MKFHEYIDLYQSLVSRGLKMQRYQFDQWFPNSRNFHGGVGHRFRHEKKWEAKRRPYYNAWPSILPSLGSLRLDIPSSDIRLPISPLLIRVPTNSDKPFRTILALDGGDMVQEFDGIGMRVDFGYENSDGYQVDMVTGLARAPGLTVEDVFGLMWDQQQASPLDAPKHELLDAVRLVCALCLVDTNDSLLVTPDVLEKDRLKYSETGDPAIVERAHRRGKFGWDIGKEMHERGEMDPHYRRPHLALRHTGKGGLIPKIVPVKGTVVHRKKLTEVPTGYLDDEQPARCEPVT